MAFLARKDKKRKHQSKKGNFDAKRRRFNNQSSSNSAPSHVNKVGDWNLQAPSTNAIKAIKSGSSKQSDCKSSHTNLLATINMLITCENSTFPCRALSDTGASLNCVSSFFVEEKRIKTTKCQRPIIGISGPEIIKR